MAGQAAAQRPNALATYIMSKKGGAEPSGQQMSFVTNTVTQSLTEMAEMAKAKMARQVLKDAIGSDERDPTQEITKVVSIAKDLAAIDESRQRTTREELKAERDMRREIQERLQTSSVQTDNAMVTMMMNMMKMQQEADHRWQERLERMEQRHRDETRLLEERIQGKKENKEKGPLEEIAHQLLVDRLNYNPDPLGEIARAKDLVNAITPQQSTSTSPDLARLQYELALRQMDKETEMKREEMKARIEIEERKARNSERILGALGPLFNMLSGGKMGGGVPQQSPQQGLAATGTGGIPQETHRYACTNSECGKEFLHPSADAKGSCPNCGSELMYVGREA